MKVVVDTNIIFSGIVSKSKTREILVESTLDMFAPEYLHKEVRKHKKTIRKKSELTEPEIETLLDIILENVNIIQKEEYLSEYTEAKDLIEHIDPDDVPFLAIALSIEADIWSDDKHFQKLDEVKTWTTPELIQYLE